MATRWRSKGTAVTLPLQILREMWDEARRRFDPVRGGRFDARSSSTMLVWSDLLDAPGAEPIGAFAVTWSAPTADLATIHWVSWVPARGSSEAQVWRAIRELAGSRWPARRQPTHRIGHAA